MENCQKVFQINVNREKSSFYKAKKEKCLIWVLNRKDKVCFMLKIIRRPHRTACSIK